MNKYWSDFVNKLVPYVPGEQPQQNKLIKLNTNENPFPPSPKALTVMRDELGEDLRLYPDPDAEQLKQAIADYYQLESANVFVGNGSDEVLAHVFYGLMRHHKPVLFPDITYSFYPVYCGLYDIAYKSIPLTDQFEIDLSVYSEIENGGIIFANPNAPTGVLTSLSAIESLLKKNTESVVVVDEAYIDFSEGEKRETVSAVSLVNQYPNLLVTQSLSKSRSLAGLRIGMAIGHKSLIEGLERVKNSFNSYPLSRVAIVGAAAAFKDQAYFERVTGDIIAQRNQLSEDLSALGFECLPSQANFVFVRHPQHSGEDLAAALRNLSIIVRHFNKPRINDFLRITVGTAEQNKALIGALKEIFGC